MGWRPCTELGRAAKPFPGFAMSVLATCWIALLAAGLLSPARAGAAETIDGWRRQAAAIRILAENDAPRAHAQALRLQAALPPAATPADRARALNLLARTEVYLAMTDQAAIHARQASDLAKQNHDRVGQAEADLNVALNAVNEGRIDKLIAASTEAVEVLDGVNRPDLLGEALLRSAMTYRRLGQIDDSVKTTLRAMEIARRTNDPLVLTYAYQGLGVSYSQSGHFAEARDYLLHMREEARAAHSKLLEAYALTGLGTTYGNLGDYRASDAANAEAVSLFRAVGSPFGVSFGLYAIAQNLSFKKRCDQALPILAEVIRIYEQHPNKIGLWYSLNLRSACHMDLGDHAAALADAERAYSLAKAIGLSLYLSESAQRIAKISAADGDYQRAYQLSVEAADMNAKAENQRIGARVVELAQRYEAESKQRQIDELTRRTQQQGALLRQRELQQRWLWTLIAASAIVLAGGAYFILSLRRSHRMLEAVNTQLQSSQGDLQQQTGILQSILDSMGDGVVVADKHGRLTLVNPAADSFLGIGMTGARADQWVKEYGLYLPDQTTPYPTVDLPLARAIRGESCDNVEVFQRNPKTLEGRWLNVTACPLIDQVGAARGGVAVFSDVTARKRADEAVRNLNQELEQRVQDRTAELRLQTHYLRALFDTLPVSVWLKDTQGRYLAVNEACAEAYGLTAEEMIGKTDSDLLPPDRAKANQTQDAAVMASRTRWTLEAPVGEATGAVWIESEKAPVLDDDGAVLGIVGVARDISERKAAEAAREAALAEAMRLARLRSEFLAQMSHELRTPLNAVLGYAQILRRDRNLTDRQASGLATIQASGQHLLTLINDVLDLSRIEAGKLEIRPVELDLVSFLRVVGDIVRIKAEEKGLLFTRETAGLPATIWADDRRLRQVLLNLLGNAVKFTDSGRVTLRVGTLGTHAAEGQSVARLRFEVEDSGVGMTASQTERIFRPFEQVGEILRQEGGAGLGLAISRQLVRLMGGNIEVRSRIGEGSLFWFELDLPIADAASLAASAPSPRVAIGYLGPRKRVLVVDDVLNSRAMMSDALDSYGFEVLEAVNGQDALDQAQRGGLDLIVMDIMMPVMDGLEATRRIRALPGLAKLPIIVVTASPTPQDQARCLAAGADAFVAKPIDPGLLVHMIAEHLNLELVEEDVLEAPAAAEEDEDFTLPGEEMDALHQLALEGYMGPIKERADHLLRLDPRYQPFARRLMRLADGYQSKAILALVERHRTQGQPSSPAIQPAD